MFPLGLLCAGEQAEIMSIRANPENPCDCRAEDMGLRVGKTVEMLNNGGGGPLLLKVDESRLAIARKVAMKILVRKQR
ncbi:MAG: FeoA family protein [Candidatus Geothermincolia bacterium]